MNGFIPPEGGEMLVQQPNSSTITVCEREPDCTAKCSSRIPGVCKHPAVVISIILILVVISLALDLKEKSKSSSSEPHAASQCPDGWFRSFYFSKLKGNWTYSQNFCSSHGASLVGIDPQKLRSLLPYEGKLDHWIGLRKDEHQVWRWANGTKFDRGFNIEEGADCAFVDADFTVVSSRCSRERKWICSKLDGQT